MNVKEIEGGYVCSLSFIMQRYFHFLSLSNSKHLVNNSILDLFTISKVYLQDELLERFCAELNCTKDEFLSEKRYEKEYENAMKVIKMPNSTDVLDNFYALCAKAPAGK